MIEDPRCQVVLEQMGRVNRHRRTAGLPDPCVIKSSDYHGHGGERKPCRFDCSLSAHQEADDDGYHN